MKPARNPGYLQWIRTLPCSVCHTTRAVEAAHTGPHGLSQKSSDQFLTLPTAESPGECQRINSI